jgi:tetratricopeptide (TPR) repeat protein
MDKDALFEIQIPQEINFNIRKNDEELQALARVIRRNKRGFLLLFVECNLLNLSTDINNRLQKMLGENIKDIFIDNKEINIFSVLAHYKNNPTPVSIIGLDELLPSDNPIPFLGQLNHNRGWFKNLNCVLILWLPEYAIRLIAEHAPDFWAWRSGTYTFHGTYQHIYEAYENTSASEKSLLYSNGNVPAINTVATENKLRTMRNILEELLFTTEDKAEKAKLLNNLGDIAADLKNWKDAIIYYQKTLDIWQELGKSTNLPILIEKIIEVHIKANNFNDAVEFAQKCSDQELRSTGFQKIASALTDKNENQAIQYYLKALEIEEIIGDDARIANILTKLGILNRNLGKFQEAIEYFKKALSINKKIDDRQKEGNNRVNLGIVYMEMGKFVEAKELFTDALEVSTAIGSKLDEQIAFRNLGNVYRVTGRVQDAIEYYKRALMVSQEIGDRDAEGEILNDLGTAYLDTRDMRSAIELYERALASKQELGGQGRQNILRNLGRAYAEMGDSRRAIVYWEQALTVFRQIGDRVGEMIVLNNLGNVYSRLGDSNLALKYLEQQLDISRQLDDKNGTAACLANIAALVANQGQIDRALALAKESENIFTQIGNADNINFIHRLISDIQSINTRQSEQVSQDTIQAAFESFIRASSPQAIQLSVSKYPILTDANFIRAIEDVINNQVPLEYKSQIKQQLEWLRQIARTR